MKKEKISKEEELLEKIKKEVDSWPEWFKNNAELVLKTGQETEETE